MPTPPECWPNSRSDSDFKPRRLARFKHFIFQFSSLSRTPTGQRGLGLPSANSTSQQINHLVVVTFLFRFSFKKSKWICFFSSHNNKEVKLFHGSRKGLFSKKQTNLRASSTLFKALPTKNHFARFGQNSRQLILSFFLFLFLPETSARAGGFSKCVGLGRSAPRVFTGVDDTTFNQRVGIRIGARPVVGGTSRTAFWGCAEKLRRQHDNSTRALRQRPHSLRNRQELTTEGSIERAR